MKNRIHRFSDTLVALVVPPDTRSPWVLFQVCLGIGLAAGLAMLVLPAVLIYLVLLVVPTLFVIGVASSRSPSIVILGGAITEALVDIHVEIGAISSATDLRRAFANAVLYLASIVGFGVIPVAAGIWYRNVKFRPASIAILLGVLLIQAFSLGLGWTKTLTAPEVFALVVAVVLPVLVARIGRVQLRRIAGPAVLALAASLFFLSTISSVLHPPHLE